ncbi:predicted protein [Botrytis cinerea T4]|uniref:Uncharacterized protein n=1 Tax=Botryotinia fuckeliana (strain T4) TaxID=999810 RepID=G2XXK5_BOTF4|nr:predicted protein [Botrytis cinerea T4]
MAVLAPSRRSSRFPISMSRHSMQIIGITACRSAVVWTRLVKCSGTFAGSTTGSEAYC